MNDLIAISAVFLALPYHSYESKDRSLSIHKFLSIPRLHSSLI